MWAFFSTLLIQKGLICRKHFGKHVREGEARPRMLLTVRRQLSRSCSLTPISVSHLQEQPYYPWHWQQECSHLSFSNCNAGSNYENNNQFDWRHLWISIPWKLSIVKQFLVSGQMDSRFTSHLCKLILNLGWPVSEFFSINRRRPVTHCQLASFNKLLLCS